MKHSEQLALSYLRSLGFTSITYEPDGNIPPDFLLEQRIAVEVRRLNQNEITQCGEVKGLETLQFALLRAVREVLNSFGAPSNRKSWFVHYAFSRPVLPLQEVKRRLKEVLGTFKDGEDQSLTFQISAGFSLDLIPSTEVLADRFELGGYSDHDDGGWLVSELEKNICLCVAEKDEKVVRVRAKYPGWWLVLIDHIGYGSRESIHIEHNWDKVVLINPLKPQQGYEI